MENTGEVKHKRKSTIRVPAKASVWYVISGAVARGIGVFGTPIFTRLLTPEEYGLYPLYTTWLAMFTVVGTLELTGGAVHRGLQRFRDKKDDFISSVLGLIFTVFSVFCMLYFTFPNIFNRITGLSTYVTTLLLVQIFLNAITSLYSAKCRFEYKYKSVALINILSSVLIPVISIALINFTDLRAESRIIGGVIVGVVIALPLLYILMRRSAKLFSFGTWKYMLRFNLPLLPHYLAMSVILRVGEITVGRVFGQAALGRYSVAMSLGLSMTMITNGVISALGPWILRKLRAARTEEISSFLLLATKMIALMSLAVLSVSPEMLSIITPPEYHDAIGAVFPLGLTVIPMFLSGAIMTGEMYYERNLIPALGSVTAALVCTVLSLLLLPYLNYTYAAVFALISYLLLAFLGAKTFRHLSGEYPIKIQKAAFIILATSLYAVLLYLFRDVFLSRMLLAAPLLPLLFFTAKQVFRRIKE